MATEISSPVTTGKIHFIRPKSWPDEEKPYCLLYIPTDGLSMANFNYGDVRTVTIRDMRPRKGQLSLDQEGFLVADFESSLTHDDYFEEDKLKSVFIDEIREFLIGLLGAKAVFVHECVIRKRSTTPSQSKNGYGQPVQEAHTDYTIQYIRHLVKQLMKNNAEEVLSRRIQMLNLWKPLRGPLRDWPLALCDYSSLSPSDLIAVDEVHKEDILESHGVQYNDSQEWYYLSDMQPNEMLIFKAADSEMKGEVPHSAFEDPRYLDEKPRESIELRVLTVY